MKNLRVLNWALLGLGVLGSLLALLVVGTGSYSHAPLALARTALFIALPVFPIVALFVTSQRGPVKSPRAKAAVLLSPLAVLTFLIVTASL